MQRLARQSNSATTLNEKAREFILHAIHRKGCKLNSYRLEAARQCVNLRWFQGSLHRRSCIYRGCKGETLRLRSNTVACQSLATTIPGRTIKQFQKKTRIVDVKDDESLIGTNVEVCGWVRTVRNQKTFSFMEVNDGSSLSGLQVVVESTVEGSSLLTEGLVNTGAAVRVQGQVAQSLGGKQKVEVRAQRVECVGSCDIESYPLQKKRHSLEFLRSIAHLRPRTNTISAVMRVRSALAAATHQFFQSNGFVYIHTPILSASDCEGAGEMFQVTTLVGEYEKALRAGVPSADEISALESAVQQQGDTLKQLKQQAKNNGDSNVQTQVSSAVKALMQLKEELTAAQRRRSSGEGLPLNSEGDIDYSTDFFSRPTFLTVSGQLNAETVACGMGDVYTFGPTFRAENSNTSRHLAEFWMIEPEMAFADLSDDMACAQSYLKYCVQYLLDNCAEDIQFFDNMYEKGLTQRLQDVLNKPFASITYTEAVDILVNSGQKFEFPVSWGSDLQSEHERYLTEVVFSKTPLIVTDYPKDIKAFYMRLNDDDKTVAAMDVLVPNVGELIGGSQREERLDVLQRRMTDSGLNPQEYSWYLDLRRYGSVPHAGFGLGFERLIQFATGVENIRDVIPFPRYPGHCDF